MKVDHRYKNDMDTKYLDLALISCGMGTNYEHADLIITIQKILSKKGGDFSILNASEIRTEWEDKWMKYEIEKQQDVRTAGKDL